MKNECERVNTLLKSVTVYTDMNGIAETCRCWLFKLVLMAPENSQVLKNHEVFHGLDTSNSDISELDDESASIRMKAPYCLPFAVVCVVHDDFTHSTRSSMYVFLTPGTTFLGFDPLHWTLTAGLETRCSNFRRSSKV